MFKADRNRIYEDALNLAKGITKSKGGKGIGKIDPEIMEFRVHYITNV